MQLRLARSTLPVPLVLLLLSTLEDCITPALALEFEPDLRPFAQPPYHEGAHHPFHRHAAAADVLVPPPSHPNAGSHDPTNTGERTQQQNSSTIDSDVICRPFGPCEPCPNDVMHEPYCQPFGNRKLLHCVPTLDHRRQDLSSPDSSSPSPSSPATHPGPNPSKPLPAYEACGRITATERADFFEFVLTNVIFVALALAGVLLRGERLRAAQATRLAARIGVGLRRASSGNLGWARRLASAEDAQAREGLLPT